MEVRQNITSHYLAQDTIIHTFIVKQSYSHYFIYFRLNKQIYYIIWIISLTILIYFKYIIL